MLLERACDTKWIIGNDPKRFRFLITIPQIRAARGLLGWSQTRLSEQAGLSLPTVKRYESASRLKVSNEAVAAIRSALETAGVIFVAENGDGPGVRLRKGQAP